MFRLALFLFALGVFFGLSFTPYSPMQLFRSVLNTVQQPAVPEKNGVVPVVPGENALAPSAGQDVPIVEKVDDGFKDMPTMATMDSSSQGEAKEK